MSEEGISETLKFEHLKLLAESVIDLNRLVGVISNKAGCDLSAAEQQWLSDSLEKAKQVERIVRS